MATYVDQAYYGWPHEELPHQDDSQEVSASKMLDHGSISFGRFAYESLSWEKRSVFTYNKCQEELEKFKSPGLVAKKKAYFEEYYKRIRAMKALQENQQTEITLDYSGDGSISSQNGEDETAVQLEDIGGGVADDVAVQLEEVPNAVCAKTIEVPIEHSDPEIMMPDSGSSRNNIEMHEHGDKSICPDETEHLDMDVPVHDSLAQCIEEPKEHDLSNHDDNGVSRENSISITNIAPEVASEEKPLCLRNSKDGHMEVKPAQNNVPRKDLPAVRKCKDNVSVPKVKEPPGRARNVLKLEDKANPNHQKPSHGWERLIPRTAVKSGNGVGSSKATADKDSRNNKSSIVASPRPLREVHSNVTTPRPFSLATDRRAAVSSASSDGALKLISKSLNQMPSAAVKGKNAIIVQGPPKRTIISNSTKSGGVENKRAREEKKKPVTLEKQSTSQKARDVDVNGSVKARPHLPPRNKFSSNSGTDIRFKDGFRNDRREEGRGGTRVTELCRPDAKVFTSPAAKIKIDTKVFTLLSAKTKIDTNASTTPAAKLRTETKKMGQSWVSNSLPSGRRPRFGEQSLDGKKTRQEKPQWR